MDEPDKKKETKEENKHLPILANGRGLALRNMDDMWRFACAVRDSGLAPKNFTRPEQIVIAIQSGAEYGIPPMKSLNCITVINGAARLWGDMPLALVRQSKLMEYIEERIDGEGDDREAICVSKRKDSPNPVETRFSVDDAIQAGLWDKAGPWKQYPERMLKYRARAFNLRDNFPDALAGIAIEEEFVGLPEPAYESETPRREDRKPVENIADSHDKMVALRDCANRFIEMLEFKPDDIVKAFAQLGSFILGGAPQDYIREDGSLLEDAFVDMEAIGRLNKQLDMGIPTPVLEAIPKPTEGEETEQLEDDFDEKMKEHKYKCLKCDHHFDNPRGKKKNLCPKCMSDKLERIDA